MMKKIQSKRHLRWVNTLLLSIALLHSEKTLPDPDGKPANMSKPVKVFILMGQSNMLGFGKVSGGEGSVEHAAKNKGKYPYLIDSQGNWTVRKDVRNVRVMNFKDYVNDWLTPQGQSKIGPEIGIGHHIGEVVDAPVLILKSCIGNRSLGWDLLPPGSQPYDYGGKTEPGYRGTPNNPKGNGQKVQGEWYAGKQYDDDTESAQQVLKNLNKYYPGAKSYEVAGFLWWQGDKDMRNPAHVAMYEKNLIQLMTALKKDFDTPNAKFVFASLGQTKQGSSRGDGKILDAMAAVAKKYPKDAAFVYTNPLSLGSSSSAHYGGNGETYMNVGEGMGKAMAELLVKSGMASSRGSKSGGSRSSSAWDGFDLGAYPLCSYETKSLGRKGSAFGSVLKSLERSAKKEDEKGGQAKAFAEALQAYVDEKKTGLLESAKTNPAQASLDIKDFLKRMRGVEGEDELKDSLKELGSIKSLKTLQGYLKKWSSIQATIAKRGESSYTKKSMASLAKTVKKLLEKDGLDERLIQEAKALIETLGG